MRIIMIPLYFILERTFGIKYKIRIAKYLSKICKNGSKILDVGCNDGFISRKAMEFNNTLEIKGIDIQDNQESFIPKKLYDGKKIPYPDNSFDVVFSIDVLHHIENIPMLLKEMRRVSKKYIIIKDHSVNGTFSYWGVAFTDYLVNVGYGIKCTFNYLTPEQWKYFFKKLGLRQVKNQKPMNFGSIAADKYHPIFKLEKI